jgi:predicted transcriptional regulator
MAFRVPRGTSKARVMPGAIVLVLMVAACAPQLAPAPPGSRSDSALGTRSRNCENSGPMKIPVGADSPTGRTELHRVGARTDAFCAVVLSIDPTFLGWLESGEKSFEYRKSFPADLVSHIIFFDNRAQSLVAVAEVVEVLAGDPLDISNRTWTRSGTTVDGLMSYFGDRPIGFAIELKNYRSLPAPITLTAARAADPKFQRPYGYLFTERHPKIDDALMMQISHPEKFAPLPAN